jgi:twitching motility two-component system response regulator PilG
MWALSREEAFTLYQKGLAAIKKGDKRLARQLLIKSVQMDARNEHAWLWLAGVAGSLKETEGCLRRVLTLNPENAWAQVGLQKTREKLKQEPAHWECPLDFHASIQQTEQCAACPAVCSFANADALLNSPTFQCPQVIEMARRSEQETVGEDDYARHYSLALVYLNLKEFERAAVHLKALMQNPTADQELIAQVEKVLARVQDQLQKTAPAPQEPRLKGNVLLVDDSATVRKLVSIVLEKENFGVICASNGMEALTILNDHHPDLILLDITMPHIDGYTLCRLIKSDDKTKDIPVVMLSGKDGFFDKVRGKMSGSTDHISKPFDPETLVQALSRYIRIPVN